MRHCTQPNNPDRGTDKLTNSATGTWECHASFDLKTRSEWAPASTYRTLQSPSSSASPRLRVNLSVPPYGMAVDKNDRLWFVETGISPNRFVGFDTVSGNFLSRTEIPSGAGSVRHMHYFQPAGEIWFGTDTNYVGRAKVH